MVELRNRISDYGEVFTSEREVKAMIDLVENETLRIDSRFFEPACGNGNFLIEVLTRKLNIVKLRYSKNKNDFERYTFLAITSIYGVDILEDNVKECRARLLNYVENFYPKKYKVNIENFIKIIRIVLSKNIINGDALTLHSPKNNKPIIFTEWCFTTGNYIKCKEYTLANLLAYQPFKGDSLFSDLGEKVIIPQPIKIHEVINFKDIKDE